MSERQWEQRQREALLEGQQALERSSQHLIRSERAIVQSETVGTTIINELEQQREVLVRANNRLTDIDYSMSQSRQLLNYMKRGVFTNKLLLILIIVCEIGIIACLLYLKFIK